MTDEGGTMRRWRREVTVALVVISGTGCAVAPERGSWGAASWPDGERLRSAALEAVRDPATWAPLAGAAVFSLGDIDDNVSEWAVRETPVFGSDPADRSDDLRDLATLAYFATALMVPVDGSADRWRGLGVGVGTMLLEGGVTTGLKELTGRERPNGKNDRSFPSGHAGQAASRAALTRYNLRHIDMPDWARSAANVTLFSVAGGAAWARVEAEKHYPSDVMFGYALGNFIARFMHAAFMKDLARATGEHVQVGFQPVGGGGAVTLTVPLY